MPAVGRAAKIFPALLAVLLTGGMAHAAGLRIEKPWMRLIIKARPAAGYFTLHNDNDAPVQLTGASSTGCGMLMLHRTKEEGGVEKMLPVQSLAVPAHGSVSFAPGGYHLMCMQPAASMAVGGNVPVTLKFADGQTLTAEFPVKGAGGE